MSLPRCSHETVVSCPTAETLEQWTGESCATTDFVQEGENYGPKDYFCKQTVKFQRRCGHFEMCRDVSEHLSLRKVHRVVRNRLWWRILNAAMIAQRRVLRKTNSTTRSHDFLKSSEDINPLETVQEGDSSNYRSYGLNIQCTREVVYIRACGHKKNMKCSEARHIMTVCDELVTAELPICGHLVQLQCHLTKHLSTWQPWQVQSPSIKLLREDSVVDDTLPVSGSRPGVLKSILKDCGAPVRFRRTTTCGHDVEMKCCDAFNILKRKQLPGSCSVRVMKVLNCGHEVPMKCSEEADSVSCHESVENPCWNFGSCASKVMVPCKRSEITAECTKEIEWLCSEGHSFALRLCSRGIPSDCLSCSSARLDAAIKSTDRILSDTKLSRWSPETARFLPTMDGVTHIAMSSSSKREFLVRKVKLLEKFREGLNLSAQWSNTLFSPVEFRVFVVLNQKLQAHPIDKFEMRDFGSPKTLNGIEVYEATQTNFKRVAGSKKVCILFGCVYTVKHLRNPVDIPKSKGRKGAKVRTWVDRQASHGYDALYRDAKSCEHGNWIIWHPYVLFPVHRVEVADSNRQNILECLPEKTQVGEPPLKVNFKKLTGVGNVEESKPDAVTQARSIMLEKDLEKLRQLAGSVSPLYEKVNVWHPWDGKSLSTGAVDAIPQRTEKSLASKLSFVSTKVANTAISQPKTPFGGISYVQTLQSQGKLKEDGNLLLALELLAVRKQETAEAQSKLDEYVAHVCVEGGGYAHPLVIVAFARLAVRLSLTHSSDIQRKLVAIFASLYPEASALWLTDSEVRLVQTSGSQTNTVGSIVSGSTSVKDKWESLNSQYSCRSDAMENLLKMVGLMKVKHAAVNMFKNAMVLQQLSIAQRKKNSMAFNYCFVGNPGTGKTTVARLFADVLRDSKIRRTNTFIECTAQMLKDKGADEFRSKLQKATGGVLFIDEAYELDPAGDFKWQNC
ncbi:unnamed protein product [Peronospora destructor]|nr:unnamed protein product [Peronospora destructor]